MRCCRRPRGHEPQGRARAPGFSPSTCPSPAGRSDRRRGPRTGSGSTDHAAIRRSLSVSGPREKEAPIVLGRALIDVAPPCRSGPRLGRSWRGRASALPLVPFLLPARNDAALTRRDREARSSYSGSREVKNGVRRTRYSSSSRIVVVLEFPGVSRHRVGRGGTGRAGEWRVRCAGQRERDVRLAHPPVEAGRRSAGVGRGGSISATGTRSRSAATASSRSARGTCTGCRPRRVATARRARDRARRRSVRRAGFGGQPVARADAGQDLLAPLAVLVLIDQRADFRAREQLAGGARRPCAADDAGRRPAPARPRRVEAARSELDGDAEVLAMCDPDSSSPRNVNGSGAPSMTNVRVSSLASAARRRAARVASAPGARGSRRQSGQSRSRPGPCARVPPAGRSSETSGARALALGRDRVATAPRHRCCRSTWLMPLSGFPP